jgi:ornithine cyclodeaminase/alanine dehydrogenase
MRWLCKDDIESVGLTPPECMELVSRTLEQHARGEIEMPAKLGVHPPGGRHIHAMSAFIAPTGALGVKWIADFPGNSGKGLTTLNAVIVLNDPETGVPTCVMDGGPITAMRTAAMTAVSLQACARPGARLATIIGTGVQARAHARTLTWFKEIRVTGLVLDDAKRFCGALDKTGPGPKFIPVASREKAVLGSDVVVTLTNAVHEPLLEPDWLKPGVTVAVLDNGGKETHILPAMDRIVTDDRRPFLGREVIGRFPGGVPEFDAEIGEILLGKAPGRCNPRERILILNLGIAASCIAVAHEVYRRAVALDIGRDL